MSNEAADLVSRAERLAEHDRLRREAARAQAQAERQAKWARIQEKAPDLAEFMGDINRAFGKPEKVWVVTNEGERIL